MNTAVVFLSVFLYFAIGVICAIIDVKIAIKHDNYDPNNCFHWMFIMLWPFTIILLCVGFMIDKINDLFDAYAERLDEKREKEMEKKNGTD